MSSTFSFGTRRTHHQAQDDRNNDYQDERIPLVTCTTDHWKSNDKQKNSHAYGRAEVEGFLLCWRVRTPPRTAAIGAATPCYPFSTRWSDCWLHHLSGAVANSAGIISHNRKSPVDFKNGIILNQKTDLDPPPGAPFLARSWREKWALGPGPEMPRQA